MTEDKESNEIDPLKELERIYHIQKTRLDQLLNPPPAITGVSSPSPLEVARAIEAYKDTLLALQQAQLANRKQRQLDEIKSQSLTDRIREVLEASARADEDDLGI